MPNNRPGRPEKKERNLEIHGKYLKGYTMKDLAKLYGLDFTTVRQVVYRYGKRPTAKKKPHKV